MIYEFPKPDDPIRQGDIFDGLPRVEVSLQAVTFVDEKGEIKDANWSSLADRNEKTVVLVPVRPVTAIVITQDCDAIRDDDISLCEIRPLAEVYPNATKAESKVVSIVSVLTQHARQCLKWFYLPPDSSLGFIQRFAIDFSISIRVPRTHLEGVRMKRRGRLGPIADEHFREKLSEYYRRYPYDEWYPLNQEEFSAYEKGYPGSKPFAWQK